MNTRINKGLDVLRMMTWLSIASKRLETTNHIFISTNFVNSICSNTNVSCNKKTQMKHWWYRLQNSYIAYLQMCKSLLISYSLSTVMVISVFSSLAGDREPPKPKEKTTAAPPGPTPTGSTKPPVTKPTPRPLICTRPKNFLKYCLPVVDYNSTSSQPFYGQQTDVRISVIQRKYNHAYQMPKI